MYSCGPALNVPIPGSGYPIPPDRRDIYLPTERGVLTFASVEPRSFPKCPLTTWAACVASKEGDLGIGTMRWASWTTETGGVP